MLIGHILVHQNILTDHVLVNQLAKVTSYNCLAAALAKVPNRRHLESNRLLLKSTCGQQLFISLLFDLIVLAAGFEWLTLVCYCQLCQQAVSYNVQVHWCRDRKIFSSDPKASDDLPLSRHAWTDECTISRVSHLFSNTIAWTRLYFPDSAKA